MLARNMDANINSFLADPVSSATALAGYLFKGSGPLAAALVAMVVIAVIWLWRRPAFKGRTNVTPRRAFSQLEGMMWSRLTSAMPDHVVLMAVPITRVLAVRKSGGLGRNQRRLDALTVDYGVFRADGTVSSVVILEDVDTALSRRQLKLRRKLLERAAIRTITWSAKPLPTVEMIAKQLDPTPIQFAAAERGVAQRGLGRGAVADDPVDPDTRLAASHASPDVRLA
jgi:uncharacterized MAPEG superfamily protein